MDNLRKYVNDFKMEHPLFAIEAEDLYCLCVAEIEQGGSPNHEREICYSALDDLLTDD